MSTCNCKSELEAALLERFKTNAPEATDHGVELAGYSFVIVANTMHSVPYMEVRTSAMHPLKKGGTRLKKGTTNMFFTYCPFCGKKVLP